MVWNCTSNWYWCVNGIEHRHFGLFFRLVYRCQCFMTLIRHINALRTHESFGFRLGELKKKILCWPIFSLVCALPFSFSYCLSTLFYLTHPAALFHSTLEWWQLNECPFDPIANQTSAHRMVLQNIFSKTMLIKLWFRCRHYFVWFFFSLSFYSFGRVSYFILGQNWFMAFRKCTKLKWW